MNLTKGKILLSEPFMVDNNFKRSAVLLVDHEVDGSVGYILNKKLDVRLNDILANFPDLDMPVYYGGPVQQDSIHYIHNIGELLDNSKQVANGVYWGGDFEKLKFLVQSELVKPHNIRFFVGYSGWSEGQLEEEMELGSWLLADLHANYVFKENPEELWRSIMERKGTNYEVIAQLPDGSFMN